MAAIYNGSDKRLKHLFEEGGGGSSTLADLTDVDLSSPTDGQALVYDGANSKWINGNVGGGGGEGGNVYSNIDFTNLLHSYVGTDANVSYTATRDCYAFITLTTRSDSTYSEIKVNNERVYYFYSEKQAAEGISVPLAKGDVLTITNTFTYWNTFLYVYGLKLIELPQTALIYSTEEREVGVWTDGKPLYQRTFFSNSSTTRTNATYDFSQDIPDIELVIDREFALKLAGSSWISGTYTNTQSYRLDCLVNADAKNIAWQALSWGFSDAFCTFRYTKTTDTAGSGTWTTTGEYAHHYSTSEKVIGTWIDGKPLYERVFTGLSVQLNSVNWVNLVAITDVKFCKDVELYRVIDATTQRRAKLPLAECDANNGYIRVSTISSTFNDVVETAIVRYTKTTD